MFDFKAESSQNSLLETMSKLSPRVSLFLNSISDTSDMSPISRFTLGSTDPVLIIVPISIKSFVKPGIIFFTANKIEISIYFEIRKFIHVKITKIEIP